MTEKPENPNAFPMPGLSGLPNGQFMHGDHGMGLRDYFAAHCPITLTEFISGWKPQGVADSTEVIAAYVEFRGRYADAMLAERAKA